MFSRITRVRFMAVDDAEYARTRAFAAYGMCVASLNNLVGHSE